MSFESNLTNEFFNSDMLNDDFFNDIVEKQLNVSRDKFKIRLIIFTAATGKSDNLVSEIYRVKIKIEYFESKILNIVDVIMKASFETIKEMKSISVFQREQLIYEYIPYFEKIWKERANIEIKFAPRCLRVESDPYEIIMLEDLKALGYEMRKRRFGLNFLETKLALSKLAKFHAASAIFYESGNEVHPCLDKSKQIVEQPPDSPIYKAFDNLYQKFLSSVKALNVSKRVVDKISKWNMQKMMDSFLVPCTPLKCGFKVLNHGDNWLNNIMFKKDDNENSFDALLLDYQMSYIGSPNADLMFMLFSSVHDDVKIKHFDEILDHFYNELINSLKELKYKAHIPTIEELREDFDQKKIFANSLFLTIIPVTRNTSGITIEITDFFEGFTNDKKLTALFFNETFQKLAETWLSFMDERGLLDIFDE
ncbi:hypothetical protein PVAND_005366 [Polypedilum vanderplanki]|uniref:CHK kinase-like domain-containing protein n=1 Tax=Polypedilum vanderplanki TaxID=319348 RepID=A0A9J6C0M9_POLVA|nr:hypothetical protein PVAND_005366 [Polypedilum vanderplanki]